MEEGRDKTTNKNPKLKKIVSEMLKKKLRGDFEVDLFKARKRSIILLKSKIFLCKGISAPLHPPAAVCAGYRNQ